MVLESWVDPILRPLLLSTGYFWTLLILTFVITIIITVIYKFTTDQDLMKRLKGELKELQKEARELRSHPDKALKVNQKMMETNSKYMMQSFKPMLFTFIPILIFFGWMQMHLAYIPIMPGEEFSVTMHFDDSVTGSALIDLPEGLTVLNGANQTIVANEATWALSGDEGEYLVQYVFNSQTYENRILVASGPDYITPETKVKKGGVEKIMVNLEPVHLLPVGFHTFGWLGTYIILSLVFSIAIRRLMKVY